jgi:5'-3' exonuclease
VPTGVLSVDGNWLAMSRFMAVKDKPDAAERCKVAFLSKLKEMCLLFSPETVAVAWDSRESHRRNRLPTYKANRPPKPDGFYAALRQIQKHLKRGKAYQFSSKGWEGDDVIATIVRTMPGPHTIYSVDKDLFQLVGPGVGFFRDIGDGFLFTDENVENETGLGASEWRSHLALWGDSCDNLGGVPGIGETYSKRLLAAYPGLVPQLVGKDTREEALRLAEIATEDKTTLKLIRLAAEHHKSLLDTWLAVDLYTVELEVDMPEGF